MPVLIDTPRPAGFPASVPLTIAERDILGWYFPFPTAHRADPSPDWLPKDGGAFWHRNPALAVMAEDACAEAIEDLRQAAVDEALARWIQPGQLAMWQVSA